MHTTFLDVGHSQDCPQPDLHGSVLLLLRACREEVSRQRINLRLRCETILVPRDRRDNVPVRIHAITRKVLRAFHLCPAEVVGIRQDELQAQEQQVGQTIREI